MKTKSSLSWVLPLLLTVLITISVMAYNSGTKLENHTVNIKQNHTDITLCEKRICLLEEKLNSKLEKISTDINILIQRGD